MVVRFVVRWLAMEDQPNHTDGDHHHAALDVTDLGQDLDQGAIEEGQGVIHAAAHTVRAGAGQEARADPEVTVGRGMKSLAADREVAPSRALAVLQSLKDHPRRMLNRITPSEKCIKKWRLNS